jgi:4-hydroxy-tetrahydrodipicolinate synthase
MKNNDSADKAPLAGVFTALVTPFFQGAVDEISLRRLVRHQLENGIKGFVVNGTTGESPTLSEREVHQVFSVVKSECAGSAVLLLGTGTNCTATTIVATQRARQWGADGALVVVPYYNKPPQRGLRAHFEAVAAAAELPLMLYNVPSRTVTALAPETVAELSRHAFIFGIKEASGDLGILEEIRSRIAGDFRLFSGDDLSCMEFVRRGGHGVVSVASHVFPGVFVQDLRRAQQGQATPDFERVRGAVGALYREANPIPVKMALFKRGILRSPELRLPLVTLSEELIAPLMEEIERAGGGS